MIAVVLKTLPVLLKVVDGLVGYLEREQLMEAGEAKALHENLSQSLEIVKRVNRARSDSANRDRVRSKYTRDDK